MAYIKTHSNYVLKTEHQKVNGGTVYERDFTTIGGMNQFAAGQTPIYESGNFIITVNNDKSTSRIVNTEKWEKNGDGEVWTLDNTPTGSNEVDDTDDDSKIVLKYDYYDLRDFAYYGSCLELIRSSLTNIILDFPGEMYPRYTTNLLSGGTKEGVTACYTDVSTGSDKQVEIGKHIRRDSNGNVVYVVSYLDNADGETVHTVESASNRTFSGMTAENVIIDYEIDFDSDDASGSLYVLDNPFGIDIYTSLVAERNIDKPLKYFCNGNYKNYELVKGDYESTYALAEWTVESEPNAKGFYCPGDRMAVVLLNFTQYFIAVQVYMGNGGLPYYMIDGDTFSLLCDNDLHIRPLKSFFADFYNSKSGFSKVLLNPNTTPKYTALFHVINENDYGYYAQAKTFEFPKTYGGYNITVSTDSYDGYCQELATIGAYYDEHFCDNLYRSMTHESIKTLDWGDDKSDENKVGGTKMQKALRLFGRGFDEIKSYIDSIANVNNVTYDQVSNIPDYLLTDALELKGWETRNVYPMDLSESIATSGGSVALSSFTSNTTCQDENSELANAFSGGSLTREFYDIVDLKSAPYDISRDERNSYCKYCEDGKIVRDYSGTTCSGDKIQNYSSDQTYSFRAMNKEFIRRLIINSNEILRHKGTIHGVEMILSMFGMHNRAWYKRQTPEMRKRYGDRPYDYEITEYTSFAQPIEESWLSVRDEYRVQWYNTTKKITYDNADGETIPYQGLLCAYEDEDGWYLKNPTFGSEKYTDNVSEAYIDESGNPVKKRKLYPFFDKNEYLDGNPYYQMNGGWRSMRVNKKDMSPVNFLFDKDNNIVSSVPDGSNSLYRETFVSIKAVNTIEELLDLSSFTLSDNETYFVKDTSGAFAVINGILFEVHNDANGYPYVQLRVNDGKVSIGEDFSTETIISIYEPSDSGDTAPYEERIQTIEDKVEGYVFNAYIDIDNAIQFMAQEDDFNGINSFVYMKDGNIVKPDGTTESYTHYFQINDVEFCNSIAVYDDATDSYSAGWRPLKATDSEYMHINAIVNDLKGNNPHNGNMAYDSGHEYFLYFKNLFKYSYENDLIDSRCYRNGDNDITDYVYPIGFSGLISDDEFVKDYTSMMVKDRKVHYFGNYFDKDGDYYVYTKDNGVLSNFKKRYGVPESATTFSDYSLNSLISGDTTYSGKTYIDNESGKVDSSTEQIVNNKRMNIKFYLHDDWFTKEGLCELKYIEDVVMHYVTQMLPPTVIVSTDYTTGFIDEVIKDAVDGSLSADTTDLSCEGGSITFSWQNSTTVVYGNGKRETKITVSSSVQNYSANPERTSRDLTFYINSGDADGTILSMTLTQPSCAVDHYDITASTYSYSGGCDDLTHVFPYKAITWYSDGSYSSIDETISVTTEENSFAVGTAEYNGVTKDFTVYNTCETECTLDTQPNVTIDGE